MKRTVFSLIAVAAVFMALPAMAGLQPDGTLNGGTNNVAANTTNTYAGTVFDCSKTTDPNFEISFACTGSSTATYTVAFDASMNQDRWVTNALLIYKAGNGTATVTAITNLSAGARFPFYRVGQIWNTNASSPALTNAAVRVHTKTGL